MVALTSESGRRLRQEALVDGAAKFFDPNRQPLRVGCFRVSARHVGQLILVVRRGLVNDLGDMFGRRMTSAARRIHEGSQHLLHQRVVGWVLGEHQRAAREVRLDPARRHGLHADAELAQLEREALAPALERPLGGVINRLKGKATRPPIDVVVMIVPEPRSRNEGKNARTSAQHAQQVRVDLSHKLLVGRRFERARQAVAGVVEGARRLGPAPRLV